MQNSARIQSLVQQLVDALVDEITAEVRMRTGSTAAAAPSLPSWDEVSASPAPAPAAEPPKFETPDFDQLLRDLEELRKPLEKQSPAVQDAEVIASPQYSDAAPVMDSASSANSKPFSGLNGASDLLKRVTGK